MSDPETESPHKLAHAILTRLRCYILPGHHNDFMRDLQELLMEGQRDGYRKSFNAGYLIACCNIENLHGEPSVASDVLAEAGITAAEVKAMDLSEYDAKALAAIREARKDDPIVQEDQADET